MTTEFLPGESAIAVRTVLTLFAAIPATILAASFSKLPDRSFRRACKAGLLTFLSWLLFTAISFKASNSTIGLLCDVAGFFIRASIFELTYRTTFKKGVIGAILFSLSSAIFTLLMTIILGFGFSYLMLALFGALQQNQLHTTATFSTNMRLHCVRTEIGKYYNTHGHLPDTLDEVSTSCGAIDFFGRPILYKITGPTTAEFASLGKDGKAGGIGADEDLLVLFLAPTPSPK